MPHELLTRWLDLWHRLDAQGSAKALFGHLEAQYAEPHRHYHTAEHLLHCLREFETARPLARHPEAIEMAIWFHDLIYDPGATDNEERSAEVARLTGESAGLSEPFCQRVTALIRATSHREPPTDPDAQILVDVDLSVLGQSPALFDDYERQIRAEYQAVPDALFAERRSAVLKGFLQRRALFSTGFFRDRYEAPARTNLSRSLAQLQDHLPGPPQSKQPDLLFNVTSEKTGYDLWQQQRRDAMNQLARKLNLPLGHPVEVWLRGHIRLRGTLRLREEMLFVEKDPSPHLQLTVDGVSFSAAEIESCVRQD